MSTVTVSPKYQIVIPLELREACDIRPGQKVALFNIDGSIRFVPIRPMREMRGFLKGMNTEGLREKQDRQL